MDQREMKEKTEAFKNDIKVKQSFNAVWEKYKKFISLYPFREHPEYIELLTPEKIYTPGAQDYFFLWIEQELKSLGHLKVGNSIIWKNAWNKTNKLKRLLKRVVDNNLSLSEKIDSDWEEISGFDSLIDPYRPSRGRDKSIAKKIVYLYYPDKVLDIFHAEDSEYFTEKLNIDFRKEAINNYKKPYEDLTVGQRFELLNKLILGFKNRSEDFKNWNNDLFVRFLYRTFPFGSTFFSSPMTVAEKKQIKIPRMRFLRYLTKVHPVILLGIVILLIGLYHSLSEREKSPALKRGISTGYTIPEAFRISQNQHLKIRHHTIKLGEAVVLSEVKNATSDEEINLGEVALVLEKKIYPRLPLELHLYALDKMVEELREKIDKETKLERVISIITHYLFKTKRAEAKEMFRPVITAKEGYYAPGAFRLSNIIIKMEGNCFGLSTLYLSLAERLGLPIYGVHTPHHIFVRYDDGKYQRNIETTGWGRRYSDEVYRSGKYSEYDRAFSENNTIYLRNLSKKEYIGMILCGRGDLFREKGDLDNVLADYNMAIELDPKSAWAYVSRGRLYVAKMELEKAWADFNKAIKLDPEITDWATNQNMAKAYVHRGWSYADKGDFNRAIADYTKAIELDPKNVSAYNKRGWVYMEQGNFNRAIADYTKAIELDPKYAVAYNNRGWIYRKQGNLNRAITDFTKAIQINPGYAWAYYNRAWAYAKKENFKQAIADGKKFLELGSNDLNAAAEMRRAVYYYWREQLRKK